MMQKILSAEQIDVKLTKSLKLMADSLQQQLIVAFEDVFIA